MLIFLIIFICGYTVSNKVTKKNIILNTNTISNNNNNIGIDDRYIKEEEYSTEKMKEMFDKKKLLDILQNKHIPVIIKTSMLKNFIPEEKVRPSNIFAGGLLDDYNFDFDL